MTPKNKTKVILNMDKKLKEAAMKKARKQDLTLSAFLNLATRAYVENKLKFDPLGFALDEAMKGKSYTHEEVVRRLRLRR